MKRYKRLLLALAAVASLYLVKATGLDQGLINEVLDALVESVTDAPVEAPAPEGVEPVEAPAPEGVEPVEAPAPELPEGQ